MDNRAIGIFDSGMGGITILSQLIKELPKEEFIYLADTKNFPYGEKTKEEILTFTKNNMEFLIRKQVKLIVIACGTATSQALEEVKTLYPVPIIGIIEPTVLELKERKKGKTIGVLATEGTIRSQAWEREIIKQIPQAEVINQACPLLATMAEKGEKEKKVEKAIQEYLKPFRNKRIDTLILGCTHYPIFKEMIARQLPKEVEIVDTSYIIAKRVKEMLEQEQLETIKEKGKYEIELTKEIKEFKTMAEKLLKKEEQI